MKGLPADVQELVKLDADKAGDVAIHRIDVQKKADANFRRVLGDNPVYFAIRPDAVLVALGDKGLDALKEALAAKPKAAMPLRVDVSVARLLAMCPDAAVAKAAEAFAKEKGSDKISITVEGGKALKLRCDTKLTLVKLASDVHKAKISEKKEKKEPEKPKAKDE